MNKIGIIGAGLSGLVTAWYLKFFNPDVDVTIFEAEKKGGEICTEVFENLHIEAGPGFLVLENPALHKIAASISQASLTAIKDNKTYVIKDTYYQKSPGGFMEFENGQFSFLSGGFWSMLGLKKKISVRDNLSFFDFLKATYGQTYAETFGSIFARAACLTEAENLNLQAAFPDIYENLKKGLNVKESLLKAATDKADFWTAMLGQEDWKKFSAGFYTSPGGLGKFIELLFNDLKQRGVHFEFSKISDISRHKDEFALHSKNSRFDNFTDLVTTGNAADMSQIFKSLHKELSVALSELKHRPVNYVYAAYPVKTFNRAGLGFFASRKEKLTISGAYYANSWADSWPEGSQYKDKFLTRTILPGDLSMFSDSELSEIQQKDFEKVFGLTAASDWSKVHRNARAIPSLDKEYMPWKNKSESLAREIPRLHLSGKDFSHGNLDLLLKDCLQTAKKLCSPT